MRAMSFIMPLLRQEKFERFHRANPHVLRGIMTVIYEMHQAGIRRSGMKAIFERLRSQTRGEGKGYKLDNDYHAYYARVAILLDPTLSDFFRTRRQNVEYVPNLKALGLGEGIPNELLRDAPTVQREWSLLVRCAQCQRTVKVGSSAFSSLEALQRVVGRKGWRLVPVLADNDQVVGSLVCPRCAGESI